MAPASLSVATELPWHVVGRGGQSSGLKTHRFSLSHCVHSGNGQPTECGQGHSWCLEDCAVLCPSPASPLPGRPALGPGPSPSKAPGKEVATMPQGSSTTTWPGRAQHTCPLGSPLSNPAWSSRPLLQASGGRGPAPLPGREATANVGSRLSEGEGKPAAATQRGEPTAVCRGH